MKRLIRRLQTRALVRGDGVFVMAGRIGSPLFAVVAATAQAVSSLPSQLFERGSLP